MFKLIVLFALLAAAFAAPKPEPKPAAKPDVIIPLTYTADAPLTISGAPLAYSNFGYGYGYAPLYGQYYGLPLGYRNLYI